MQEMSKEGRSSAQKLASIVPFVSVSVLFGLSVSIFCSLCDLEHGQRFYQSLIICATTFKGHNSDRNSL